MNFVLQSSRLLLRQWRDEDREPFASMNRDPHVMEYFPRLYSRQESDDFVSDNIKRISNDGWGAWAVEVIGQHAFVGYVGFAYPAAWHPCAGSIEIGWRLSHAHWGLGYATEAATLALNTGFDALGFNEVISFTSSCNLPSIAVMKKIGLIKDEHGFEHPRIETSSRLCSHVIYRLNRAQWKETQSPRPGLGEDFSTHES